MATNAVNGGAVASVLVPQAQKNGERLSAANFDILPGSTTDVFGPVRNAMPTGAVLYLPSAGAQGWQAPSYGTPEGMSFEADGPDIQANQLLGEGSGTWTWGKAWAARLPHNNGNGNGAAGYSMSVSTYGSGYPTNDQTVLAIKANKDIYNQSGVPAGGLGGIVMSVCNGSPSGVQSDTYAYNRYVGVGYASGFAVIAEETIAEGCSNYSTNCYETDVQKGIEDSAGNTHLGEQWAAGPGVHQALFRTLGSVAGGDRSSTAYQQTGITGRGGDLILNQLDGVDNFQITEANVGGVDTWTNGAGTTILQLGQNGGLGIGGANSPVQGLAVRNGATIDPLSVSGFTDSGSAMFKGLVARSSQPGFGLAAASITVPAAGSAPPSGTGHLNAHFNLVTACCNGAVGSSGQPVQLPSGPTAGSSYDLIVANRSGDTCAAYPPAGGTIETDGVNLPISLANGADAIFHSQNPTTWYQ